MAVEVGMKYFVQITIATDTGSNAIATNKNEKFFSWKRTAPEFSAAPAKG
jgi:hypothetical protein